MSYDTFGSKSMFRNLWDCLENKDRSQRKAVLLSSGLRTMYDLVDAVVAGMPPGGADRTKLGAKWTEMLQMLKARMGFHLPKYQGEPEHPKSFLQGMLAMARLCDDHYCEAQEHEMGWCVRVGTRTGRMEHTIDVAFQ
jgi:hypothetical protein